VEVEPASLVIRDTDGRELRMQPDLAVAEGRYEDWVYLSMLEWRRPADVDLYGSIPENNRTIRTRYATFPTPSPSTILLTSTTTAGTTASLSASGAPGRSATTVR